MRLRFVATASFMACLPGQEAVPLDLQAIGARLAGDGALPDALAAMPADWVAWYRDVDELLTLQERQFALRWLPEKSATIAVAVGVLARSDAAKATEAHLWREVMACSVLAHHGRVAKRRRLQGNDYWEAFVAVGERAAQRCKRVAATLLREHPETRHANQLLRLLAAELEPAERAAARERALRAGESRWDPDDHAAALRELIRAGDLDRAERVLTEAVARPPLLEAREAEARRLRACRGDIELARVLAPQAGTPGLEGRIAAVRLMDLTDHDRAIDMSRTMVAEGVEHAMPSLMLAADAMRAGEFATSWQHLERARTLPGRCVATGASLTVDHKLPALDGLDPEVVRSLVTQDLDAWAGDEATDAGEADAMLRALRALGWPFDGDVLENLTGIAALAAAHPGSPDAQRLLVAAALLADDVAAARAALERPLPAPVADDPRLVRERAVVAVALALTLDEADADRFTAPFLAALAATGGDAELHSLQGVLAWSRGLHEDADEHFSRDTRFPFERGGLMTACARLLAGYRARGDWSEREELRILHAANAVEREVDVSLPLQVTRWRYGTVDQDPTSATTEAYPGLLPAWRFALEAARAFACDDIGNGEAAGTAARAALAARTEAGPWDALARGVLLHRRIHWRFGLTERGPGLEVVDLACEFFLIPDLPTRERLEELAR
jgi:hypothetical protein